MGNGGGKGREKGRKFGGRILEEIHGKKGYLGIPREIRGFGLRRFEQTLRFEKRGKREGKAREKSHRNPEEMTGKSANVIRWNSLAFPRFWT